MKICREKSKLFLTLGNVFYYLWGVVGNCGENNQMRKNVSRTIYIFY